MKKILKIIQSYVKKNQRILFWIVFFSIIIFRIWLSTGVPKLFIYGPHDDLFFARAAHSIIRGSWMGPYDQYTLIKGPFYAFFLVLSFLSGLPLYLNETIFYVGACLTLFFALKPLLSNYWWRLFIATFLMFTPNSFTIWMHLRVYREFVYYSLSLYVIAFTIGLLLRLEYKPKYLLFWSLGLGLSMSAFLLTREEGIWIYPMLGIVFIIGLIKIWRQGNRRKPFLKSLLLLLPIPVWFIPIIIISFLNYSNYGFWGVSEQLEPEFNRVLNTLARIETEENWHPAIQISKSARLAAYDVSPTLGQFEDLIERYVEGWNIADNKSMALKPEWYLSEYGDGEDELGNGHFLWLLRDVVYARGYYSDGSYPKELYRQIGNELEMACQSGELVCKKKTYLPAIVGGIDKRHIPIITQMFFENIIHMVKLDFTTIHSLDIDNHWPVWPVDNEDYAVFEQFSYNPIDTIDTVKSDDLPRNINGVIDLRFRILLKKGKFMEEITKIFDIILFPLSILALSFWFILVFITLFRNSKKEHLDFLLISFFVLGAFLSRIGTLTIVDATTSIPGIFYSQSTQIFLTLFSILMLTWGINFLQKKIKNSNHIMSTIKENSI